MHPRTHFLAGLRSVLRTPSLLAWVYLTTLVVALPLTLAMRELLQGSFEGSLMEDRLRQGFDLLWYQEFAAGRTGLGKTFGPTVVGILPVLSNLERLLDGKLHQVDPTVLGAGILMVLAWCLLLGGILSRFAHEGDPHLRAGFLAQGGLFFWRFLRLSVISGLLYWGIFRGIGQPLHRWIESATRDTTVERTVLIYTVLAYVPGGTIVPDDATGSGLRPDLSGGGRAAQRAAGPVSSPGFRQGPPAPRARPLFTAGRRPPPLVPCLRLAGPRSQPVHLDGGPAGLLPGAGLPGGAVGLQALVPGKPDPPSLFRHCPRLSRPRSGRKRRWRGGTFPGIEAPN